MLFPVGIFILAPRFQITQPVGENSVVDTSNSQQYAFWMNWEGKLHTQDEW